jgi:hypothetical protein
VGTVDLIGHILTLLAQVGWEWRPSDGKSGLLG